MEKEENVLLRNVLGTPEVDGDGIVGAVFETVCDGFMVVAPAPVRKALEASLDTFGAELPAGGAFEACYLPGGDIKVVASGLAGWPTLALAEFAQRIADALCEAAKTNGGGL